MIRRLWGQDRAAVVLVAASTLLHGLAWRARTAPMGDSGQYRADGLTITGGWDHLTDRTPGYPLVLWATGSLRHETVALFVVQAALHAIAVLLAVDIAWRIGTSRRGRFCVAALLVALPTMVPVRYAGTEALTQLLVVLAAWAVVRWIHDARPSWLVVAGCATGAAVWVRPACLLVAAALLLVVGVAGRHGLRAGAGALARVLGPVALATAALLTINAVRFDRAELTPLTGWYLASRTSTFVERLPASDEPARAVLIAERDRQLLRADEVDAPNYAFAVRDELGRALGRDRAGTDAWMLRANLGLIARHPFEYVDTVGPAAIRFGQVESQPAVQGLGRPATWALSAIHLLLLGAFALQAVFAPGILWSDRGRRDRRTLALSLIACLAVTGAIAAGAVLFETGTSRLRSPVDPLLAVVLVAGWEIILRARAAARDGARTVPRDDAG